MYLMHSWTFCRQPHSVLSVLTPSYNSSEKQGQLAAVWCWFDLVSANCSARQESLVEDAESCVLCPQHFMMVSSLGPLTWCRRTRFTGIINATVRGWKSSCIVEGRAHRTQHLPQSLLIRQTTWKKTRSK
ncbi:unnamed protein product [Protopolystoma xenopodis]|uniref:Uncharacterized protein n=1 Tax=Protopolystoma xenopodis TaxID=117903 RepID=A0A3S5ACH7_9PLAT|nr:unnamed protein product [Protopolystoma xenopodis]